MKCSICKQEGHNKRSCKMNDVSVQPATKRRSCSVDFYTDNSLLPSSADMYWLLYGKHGNIHGKWMLFYDKARIDKEWAKMKQLYDESKLGNVISMKCSGAKPNPRASDKNNHVIIVYCPESDIMSIGNIIVENLVDYSSPYIYYKSDTQTRAGTTATGQTVNHLCKLPTKKVEVPPTTYVTTRQLNNIVTKEGYCSCGRKEEEGSFGCTRYPSCVNDGEWY